MALLHKHKSTRIDTYEYKMSITYDSRIRQDEFVTIKFQDGKFKHCDFPTELPVTREGWRILAEIHNEISELEKLYEDKDE